MSLCTSIHEAAHLRVALHYGFEVVDARIEDPRTGVSGRARTSIPPNSAETEAWVAALPEEERRRLYDLYLMEIAIMALAGPEAERLLAPDSTTGEIDVTSGSDQVRAADAIWERTDSPQRIQANLATARAEARRLVREYANDILLIACDLTEHGSIDGARVGRIIAARPKTESLPTPT